MSQVLIYNVAPELPVPEPVLNETPYELPIMNFGEGDAILPPKPTPTQNSAEPVQMYVGQNAAPAASSIVGNHVETPYVLPVMNFAREEVRPSPSARDVQNPSGSLNGETPYVLPAWNS